MRPHSIWLDLIPKLNRHSPRSKSAQRKRKLLRSLLRKLKETHPELYGGVRHATLTKEMAEAFCSQLRQDAPGHVFKYQNNVFIRGLERGKKELNWNVYIPPIVSSSTRDRPNFTQESMRMLRRFRDIEKVFLASLERELPNDKAVLYGYLTFSACAFGGLLERRWLISWLRDPMSGLVYEDGLAWVELYIESENIAFEHRRWFIDPLTLMILCRIHPKLTDNHGGNGKIYEVRQESSLGTYLERLWRHLDLSKDTKPATFSEFLRMAYTRIAIYSRPFLAEYAVGKIKGTSVPPEAWMRLRTSKCVRVPVSMDDDNEEIHKRFSETPSLRSKVITMGPSLRSEIFDIIHPKECRESRKRITTTESKKNLQDFIDRFQSRLTMLGWLLCQWAIFMMTHKKGKRKRSRIAPSTVRTYLACIAKSLDILIGSDNFLEYTEREFYS